jgi:O-antigen/teichoic acid export membrane protein
MAATLRRNFLTLLVARGLALGLAVVNALLLARYLGPRDFGLYTYAFSVTTIVFGLADLGLTSHAVR